MTAHAVLPLSTKLNKIWTFRFSPILSFKEIVRENVLELNPYHVGSFENCRFADVRESAVIKIMQTEKKHA